MDKVDMIEGEEYALRTRSGAVKATCTTLEDGTMWTDPSQYVMMSRGGRYRATSEDVRDVLRPWKEHQALKRASGPAWSVLAPLVKEAFGDELFTETRTSTGEIGLFLDAPTMDRLAQLLELGLATEKTASIDALDDLL